MSDALIDQIIARASHRRRFDQGAYLFHQGDPVASVFVIDAGLVELKRHQLDGAAIVLQRAAFYTVLAEASVYAENYHCDAVAELPTNVFELSKSAFLQHLREDGYFSHLWAAHLAREVQSARYRSEILSLRTVAERLDGWLAWRGDELPPKGEWKSIARQIAVSPEALYRELARRGGAGTD